MSKQKRIEELKKMLPQIISGVVGYSVIVTCVIWIFMNMISMIVFGGVITYEFNLTIALIELIFVSFGLLFSVSKLTNFLKNIGKD